METVHLDDFLTDGILKEDEFRKKVQLLEWAQYNDKKVLIKGCTKAPVPIWSYLIIATKLSHCANSVFFGEPCSLVKIYSKD